MRFSSLQTGLVVALVLFFVSAPLAVGQDAEPAQEPEQPAGTGSQTLDLFMDATEAQAANLTLENQAPVYSLVEGSGAATTIANPCAAAMPQSTAVGNWVYTATFPYPVTFLGSFNLTIGLVENQAPVAASASPVDFDVVMSAGPSHQLAVGSATASPELGAPLPPGTLPGGLPAGPLPSEVTVPMDFGDNPHTMPAGLPVLVTVSIACAQQGDWNAVFGDVPPLDYVIGAPGAPDADGDGIPDEIDEDDDNDLVTDALEEQVGSDPRDQTSTPTSTSSTCPGYTYQEVFDETGSPDDCPVEGSFPWLLLILIILVVVLLGGAGAGAFVVVNKKIKMTVSHDGFQALEKGQAAEYELTLMATGKKEEQIPVELTLKGVPEDWSASLEPSHLTLMAGEAAEAQMATLRLTPPPGEEYEAEAQVVVTATPTDEEGKTSAMKPGTSVKTKTIVNIGVTPPEGEKKPKKPKKEKKPKEEEAAAEDASEGDEEGGKKKGFGGMLKRKKKEDTPAEEEAEAQTEQTAREEPAAGAAAAAPAAPPAGGKPSIAMGKMVHDPADFSAGDEVTTTVTVRNKGDGPVEGLTLSLYVNDQRAAQQSVDLGPGDSTEVTFHWTAQPDENRVRLKGSMKGA